MRLHDLRRWAGGMYIPNLLQDVLDTLLVLRLNEYSSKVAELADEAVQEMYARRAAT